MTQSVDDAWREYVAQGGSVLSYSAFSAGYEAQEGAVSDLVDAIRLTVEYLGNDTLPAIEGWSWFDALNEYAPDVAQQFVDHPIHFSSDRSAVDALYALGVGSNLRPEHQADLIQEAVDAVRKAQS